MKIFIKKLRYRLLFIFLFLLNIFVYRGDFSFEEKTPLRSIIQQCDNILRKKTIGVVDLMPSTDFTSKVKLILPSGEKKDIFEMHLKKQQFLLSGPFFPPNPMYQSMWSIKNYDQSFIATKKESLLGLFFRDSCQIVYFVQNNVVIDWHALATVEYRGL